MSEAAIEQGLIETIERDPANEEAYAVYADWLQAQGSLRGELATLQLGTAVDIPIGLVARGWRGADVEVWHDHCFLLQITDITQDPRFANRVRASVPIIAE